MLVFKNAYVGGFAIVPGKTVDVLHNHQLCGVKVVTVDEATKTFEAWVPGEQTAKTFTPRDLR